MFIYQDVALIKQARIRCMRCHVMSNGDVMCSNFFFLEVLVWAFVLVIIFEFTHPTTHTTTQTIGLTSYEFWSTGLSLDHQNKVLKSCIPNYWTSIFLKILYKTKPPKFSILSYLSLSKLYILRFYPFLHAKRKS